MLMNTLSPVDCTLSVLTPRGTEEKICDSQSVSRRRISRGSVSQRLKYSARRPIATKKLLAREAVRSHVKGIRGHAFLPPVPVPTVAGQVQIKQIASGKWGAFFLASPIGANLVTAGIPNTPAGMAQIDNMFKWGITFQACGGSYEAIRKSYARAIMDLMALPTGQGLFQNIITGCNANSVDNRAPGATMATRRPECLTFVQDGGASGLIYDDFYPARCGLNLELDAGTVRLIEGHNVLIVNNTATNALDFVGVAVSPALDLAHELGHFLYALGTLRGAGGTVYRDIVNRTQGDYNTIFNGVIPLPLPLPLPLKRFRGLWNHGVYAEAVNILPSAAMGVANVFPYSDGIMVGEALNVWGAGDHRCPQFFTLTNAAGVAGAAAPANLDLTDGHGNLLPSNRFIRFSHRDSVWFFNKFNGLAAAPPPGGGPSEQDQFRALVGNLLNNITIPAGPGGVPPAHQCTINDLPRI
jgi:hypothetical protein